MDAISLDTTVKTSLTDVRAKLEKGLRIAKAAETCAGSGRIRKGVEIALSLEPIVYELNTQQPPASQATRNREQVSLKAALSHSPFRSDPPRDLRSDLSAIASGWKNRRVRARWPIAATPDPNRSAKASVRDVRSGSNSDKKADIE